MYAATYEVLERRTRWTPRVLLLMGALALTGAALSAFSSSGRASAG